MPPASSQHLVIEALRDQVRRLERRPTRRFGFLSSGWREVDALLPGRGFPRGALADLSGGPASGKTLLALAVLAEAQRDEGLASFVDGCGELYPPAARALGLDLDRLLVVRMGDPSAGPAIARHREGARERVVELLWAAEALLASNAFAAVAIDVPMTGMPAARAETMLRRLQAAAEKGGAAGLWLRASGLAYRVPAVVRLEIEPRSGEEPVRVRCVRASRAA